MILCRRPASFISSLPFWLWWGKKTTSPTIGNDQRQCYLINNFGVQEKEVWENKSFPAPLKTKLVHRFRLAGSEGRREERHSHSWPVIKNGTFFLFLSLSSFCLSMDCHHCQSSQVSHCQLTSFFKEGLPEKSIGFPIPVPMELVKCLFFDKTLNVDISNSKKGKQFPNYFHLLFSPFCTTPMYFNKLITLCMSQLLNTDFPQRKETLFSCFFGDPLASLWFYMHTESYVLAAMQPFLPHPAADSGAWRQLRTIE